MLYQLRIQYVLALTCVIRCAANSDVNFVMDVQNKYCLESANFNENQTQSEPLNTNNSTDTFTLSPSVCCNQCATDVQCELDDSCCPNKIGYIPTLHESNLDRKAKCIYPQLKPWMHVSRQRYPHVIRGIKIFQRCPLRLNTTVDGFYAQILEKCEDDDENSVANKLPVTDLITGKHFKNKYCATCHGIIEEHQVVWGMEVNCILPHFKLTSIVTLVDAVLQSETCNLIYINPIVLDQADKCTDVVSTCNVTGEWQQYDPLVERTCLAYASPFRNIYRNVFCYICNGVMDEKYECYFGQITETFGFSMIINFAPERLSRWEHSEADTTRECASAIYDPFQEMCVKAYCMQPKIYINGSCVSFARTIGGVGYRVFLMFIPLSDNRSSADTAHCLQEHVLQVLSEIGLTDALFKFGVHVMKRDPNKQGNTSADAAYYVVHFDMYFQLYRISRNMSSVDEIVRLHGNIIQLHCQGFETENFFVRLDNFGTLENETNGIVLFNRDSDCQCNVPLERMSIPAPSMPPIYEMKTYNQSYILHLKSTYSCPLVKLNPSFYKLKHMAWGVTIPAYSVTLNFSEYSAECDDAHSDVCVCKSTLDDIAAHVLNKSTVVNDESATVFALNIIALLLYVVYIHNC